MFRRKLKNAPIEGPLTAESLRGWLTEELAGRTGVTVGEIDTARSFEEYGLDSRAAVQVSGDLEKVVERRLSPAILLEHQSIDELVTYLASQLSLSEV